MILCGRLTRDPEQRAGGCVAFGLAVSHKYRTAAGESREETCFVDVAAFGRTGEAVYQHCVKGVGVLCEGRLRLEQWQAQDGSKRSRHSIVADRVVFMGGRRDDDAAGDDRRSAARGGSHSAPPVDDVAPAPRTTYRDGGFHPGGDGPNYIDEALAAAGREPAAVGAVDDEPPPTGDEIPF